MRTVLSVSYTHLDVYKRQVVKKQARVEVEEHFSHHIAKFKFIKYRDKNSTATSPHKLDSKN